MVVRLPWGTGSPRAGYSPPSARVAEQGGASGSGASPPPVPRPTTRAQHGIRKPKVYTNGTVRYNGFFTTTGEPSNLDEAFSDSNWKRAMDCEHMALIKNKTWHLVPPDRNKNIIDCMWVYKVKRKSDGTIDRYRARLVAKSFSTKLWH